MIPRNEVYAAIDTERSYQDRVWGDDDSENTPAAFVAYMRMYLNDTMLPMRSLGAEVLTADEVQQMRGDSLRKIAGLAVACLETHGVPQRTPLPGLELGPTERAYVYAAIEEERAYQMSPAMLQDRGWTPELIKPAGRSGIAVITQAEYLVLLDAYIDRARDAWVDNEGNIACLHVVRKIAAIAVAAMEFTGAPIRTNAPTTV
jgi:hypothetical protein